ncbi:proline reductase cluster protein PrdD [Vagococcus hydrophili]|nr:proline reductase cluster protein PrdD [Vagococcus hydrophili]
MNKELKIKAFHMEKVTSGDRFQLDPKALQIKATHDFSEPDFKEVSIQLLAPNHHEVETNTIMDIIPISTKVLGKLGEGITHTLTGVYVVLTGAIEQGEQMHEFGSSEGILSENLKLNRVGTPLDTDYIIHIDILANQEVSFTRELCLKMFEWTDNYIGEIRELLKMMEGRASSEVHTYVETFNEGKPRVVLVKQVAGQGAMYDNLVFPDEPSGFSGGTSIIDMNNVPIIISPNEYRDGAIRAMV